MPLLFSKYRIVLASFAASTVIVSGCASIDPAGSASSPQSSPQSPARAVTAEPSPPSAARSAAAVAPQEAPAPAPAQPVATSRAERQEALAVRESLAAALAPATDAAGHADLWARIRAGFAMPELDTPLVAQKERFYLAQPEYLQRMFARGSRYLHFIVEEIEKRGMPTEIALLPFVESAMNPVALSHAQAAGLWQFIPATGLRYDLSQDWWVDERRDVVRSTRAALDYLQAIHAMHGNDWFLALASYNWGENAVARAVRNNRAKGLPADYLNLRMPNETRHYVPKLIALKHIVMRADEMGVKLPELPDEPYFTSITKTRPIDLTLAAQFAGMSVQEFVALNPSHNRPVIAATRSNRLRLPADRVEHFSRSMERHVRSGRPLATWQPYTLAPGESLADVARRAGITQAELRKANGLDARVQVLAGSRMLAPQPGVADEMRIRSFDGPRVYTRVQTPAVHHVVRRGESLGGLARRYGVSVETLRQWNGGTRTARTGARLVVRPARTQTVLTMRAGETGAIIRTSTRATRATPPPAARSGSPARAAERKARTSPQRTTVRTPAPPAAKRLPPASGSKPIPRVRT